jgi:L-ascorbate metabolism protein UlaG (beta-lactamase superfamily)
MRLACAVFAALFAAFPALAQNVKLTPIGSHPGELCANDRAIVFEDPTGVRVLYDAGPTVTGGNDPRLGAIHVVLLTHMHGDHVGDLKLKAPGEGTCANSARVSAPNSTTAEVVAAKNAVLVTTRAMAGFVHNKVDAIHGAGGKPMDFCPNLAVSVPVPAACSSRIDLGGVFTARAEGAKNGVEFTIVYSLHDNAVSPALLTKPQQDLLKADGAQLQYGPPVGFVVKFTNGLVVYLSSDTAVFGDMRTVIHDFHKATLAVINLGPNPGLFQSGAYAINDLLKPASVIFTHVNEVGTEGGKLRTGSQTAALMKEVKAPAYLAISERTMEFDGKGKCVLGCARP